MIFCYKLYCGETVGLLLPPAMSIKILNRPDRNVLVYQFKNYPENKNEDVLTLPYGTIKEIIDLIKENSVIFSFDSSKLSDDVKQNLDARNVCILDSNGELIEFNDEFHSLSFCSDIREVDHDLTFELETIVSLVCKISKILEKNGIEVHNYLPARFL